LSTKYPGKIDGQGELPVSIDLVTPVKADVVNNLRGAIIAIESELGTDPSRDFGTVKARIDALERGGGGGLRTVLDEGTVVLNDVTELNFKGPGVTATVATQPGRVDVTITGSGGTSLFQVQETLPTTNGQTAFTLSEIPQDSTAVEMFVNGLKQAYGTDYTATGAAVTYAGVPLITSDVVEFWYITSASSTIGQVQETIPISFNGQTSIILSSLPVDGKAVQMYVNGDKEDYGTDYTVSGTTVSWISGDFSLVTTDVVEFWYVISGMSGGGGSQTLAQTLVLGNVTGGTDISMTNGDAIVAPDGYLDLNVLTGGINPPLIRFKKNGIDFLTFNPSASVNMMLADNAGDFRLLYESAQPILNTNGSFIEFSAQDGNGTGSGGLAGLAAGAGGANGIGGNAYLTAGNGGAGAGDAGGGDGGNVLIMAVFSSANTSGDISIEAGTGTSGNAGSIFLAYGAGGTTDGTFTIYGPPNIGASQSDILIIDPDNPISFDNSSVLGSLSPALHFQYTSYETSLIHFRQPGEGNGAPTIYAGMGGITGGTVGLIAGYGSNEGGAIVVEGGQCTGSGPGGDVTIQSGTPIDGSGGNIRIRTTSGVNSFSPDTNGGNILIQSGAGTGSGTDGYAEINLVSGSNLEQIKFSRDGVTQLTTLLLPSAGIVGIIPQLDLSIGFALGYFLSLPPTTLNAPGGAVALVGQPGNGSGAGGFAGCISGDGGPTGDGGGVAMTCGDGYGNGGSFTVDAGDASFGNGGSFYVNAGISAGGNGAGGFITLASGYGNNTGPGGSVNLQGGDSGNGLGASGGTINITAGSSVGINGDGGDIILTTGLNTGTGTYGDVIILSGDGNIDLGTAGNHQSMKHGVFLADSTAVPTGNPTAGIFIYSDAGAGKARGTSGTVTTWAPAEPHCPRCTRDFALQWENEKTGKLSICMWCASEGYALSDCVIEKVRP